MKRSFAGLWLQRLSDAATRARDIYVPQDAKGGEGFQRRKVASRTDD